MLAMKDVTNNSSILRFMRSKPFLGIVRGAMFFSGLLFGFGTGFLPLFESTIFHVWLLKLFAVLPWVLLSGLLLHIPFLIERVARVKAGGAWFDASPRSNYQPWPAHSNPVARRTAWGGLDPDNDVMCRDTSIRVVGEKRAVQRASTSRLVRAMICLVIGLGIAAVPMVVDSLVYEVPPPEVVALKNFTSDLFFLFYAVALVLLVPWIVILLSQLPIAFFNKQNNSIKLGNRRFFGLLSWPKRGGDDEEHLKLNELSGLQIISYRTKKSYGSSGSSSGKGSRHLQYELNLVFSDGRRRLLAKQHVHKPLQKDALRLAHFLNIPVWDRSQYYNPDNPLIISPWDPLLQPL